MWITSGTHAQRVPNTVDVVPIDAYRLHPIFRGVSFVVQRRRPSFGGLSPSQGPRCVGRAFLTLPVSVVDVGERTSQAR